MCGIFGTISRKSKPFNKRAFCTMGVRNDSRGGDSCGVFIDGLVEYGVDKQKLFINFFRDSLLLDTTTECKVALGHCRKASVGKVSVETAQPVVLRNEEGEVEYVLIHNGTIYNYKELAEKYIPDVNIEGLTDSQVMARIFYHKGYDCLDEYNGGAVFVIHDYRVDKSYIFKGQSKKYTYSTTTEEERPLYFCWHNGRFCFSSIFETLYAHYYEDEVYIFPSNKLMVLRGEKMKLVKEYKRENATQNKAYTITTYKGSAYDEDDLYPRDYYANHYRNPENDSFKIKFEKGRYMDEKKKAPMHGIFYVSKFGYVFPNKKAKETWLEEVGFFQGRLLKHPKAFTLINDLYQKNNKVLNPSLSTLVDILDFNPFSEDGTQFYWYDGESLMVPQGEWIWPMADWSCVFDSEGIAIQEKNSRYDNWISDYKMYTYDENEILANWKMLCGEV